MDFKAKFNKTAVLDFLKNKFLPEDFSESRQAIDLSQLSFAPEKIKEIEFIGEASSLDGLRLYVIRHDSESDPRVTLSREIFRVMSCLGTQRTLVIFHSASSDNYRLSLATITLALKGAKTKREYSNPRRHSFFLGPEAKTHTPEDFLLKKGRIKDFDDLLGRFSIEVVNKEFYNKIAIKFTELVGGKRKVKTKVSEFKPALRLPGLDMSKPESHIMAQEFAVRLIGRIVFCWFLKRKKSPAGIPLLPESVLSSVAVDKCEKSGDNYYHSVLENFFFQVLNTEMGERGKDFAKAPYDKIPFLNGGLFEPHDGDFYDFDAVTVCSRNINTLKIPNAWFQGFVEILETYNFTIDENTSVDVELAVDPEMLGRIFENLLAEINPETGETARKSTGSYYTPRPIVEYMVDEGLKEYLKIKTGIAEDTLSDLLSFSDSDTNLSEPEKEKVISALDEVKIIDPACGSGAFPMGMLQKIVLVLQKVDPNSQKWLSKLLDSVPDATARAALRKKLEGEADLWNYTRKLGVIRKSIYGVDIQPIAVEISKLRFFLSLVVDEKVDDKKKNRAIEPLPNLEFKIVCANTLIGLPKDEAQLFDDLRDIDSLKNLRDRYFTASGHAKLKVENEFLTTQHKMLKRSLGWGKPDTKAMKLSQWEPFKNKSTEWFDLEWMFGLKEGFDIAIANPPYVRVDNIGAGIKKYYKEEYTSAQGKYDLYYLFFEKALQLAPKGVLSFITPNKYCAASSACVLRGMLFKNGGEIVSTSMLDVFKDAANYPVISVLNKNTENDLRVREALSLDSVHESTKNVYGIALSGLSDLPNSVVPINVSQERLDFVLRLLSANKKMSMWMTISEGLRIPEKYESVEKCEYKIVKQFQFERYSRIEPGANISAAHLKKVASEDSDRFRKIIKNKIVIAEDSLRISATLDANKHVPQGGVYFGTLITDAVSIETVLAILNSKLLSVVYKVLYGGMHMGGGYLRFRTNCLDELPVPTISASDNSKLKDAVNELYAALKHDKTRVESIDKKIDAIVFRLYGLAPKEIAIVTGL